VRQRPPKSGSTGSGVVAAGTGRATIAASVGSAGSAGETAPRSGERAAGNGAPSSFREEAPVTSGYVRVSTRGDYACRALLSLALHGATSTPTSVRDIAERTGLPQPYLEQILLALKGAGLVRSKRGVGGGYVLAREPADITLAQVVSAVDGPIVAGDFGEPHENGACDHEGQCVLLAVWAEVGATMREHLQSFTLADMVRRARGNREARLSPAPGSALAKGRAGATLEGVLQSLVGSGSSG
jgi:Rrf2 family protein